MNNKQKIVIAALVVLLLAATAFMLYSLGVFGKKGQKTPSLPSQVEEGERISRLDRTWRLIFETEEQTIDLSRKKEEGKYIWTLTDDENFPISTDKVNSIASAFSGMHSIEKIELKDGAEELKKYGLDQPVAWLTAGDAKENEQRMKLLFGDLTGEKYKGDDLIYVSIEDEPEVVYKVVNNILPPFFLYSNNNLAVEPSMLSTCGTMINPNSEFPKHSLVPLIRTRPESANSSAVSKSVCKSLSASIKSR